MNLPELPKGYYWKVIDRGRIPFYGYRYNLLIKKHRWYLLGFGSRVPNMNCKYDGYLGFEFENWLTDSADDLVKHSYRMSKKMSKKSKLAGKYNRFGVKTNGIKIGKRVRKVPLREGEIEV